MDLKLFRSATTAVVLTVMAMHLPIKPRNRSSIHVDLYGFVDEEAGDEVVCVPVNHAELVAETLCYFFAPRRCVVKFELLTSRKRSCRWNINW